MIALKADMTRWGTSRNNVHKLTLKWGAGFAKSILANGVHALIEMERMMSDTCHIDHQR
jgi:hypothetical protein